MHPIKLANTSRVFNRRRSKRCILDRRTSADVRANDRRYECLIEDISLGGARLRFDGIPPADRELVLEHAGTGELCCERVWRIDGAIGVRFEKADRQLDRELQCVAIMVSPDDDRPTWF